MRVTRDLIRGLIRGGASFLRGATANDFNEDPPTTGKGWAMYGFDGMGILIVDTSIIPYDDAYQEYLKIEFGPNRGED